MPISPTHSLQTTQLSTPMCTRTNSATSTYTHSCEHCLRDRWVHQPRTLGHTAADTLRLALYTRPDLRRTHLPALPRRASGSRVRACAPPSARVWVTAPRPGPRPFLGPKARSSSAPAPGHSPARGGLGCRRGDPRTGRREAGRIGGSHKSWRRRSRTLARSVPPPARARARALPPLPAAGPRRPLRSCALPPRRLGGVRAAPSPRPILPLPQAFWMASDPLSSGFSPISKIGTLRPKLTQRVRPSISASSRAPDT